jgi:hypothetical protein
MTPLVGCSGRSKFQGMPKELEAGGVTERQRPGLSGNWLINLVARKFRTLDFHKTGESRINRVKHGCVIQSEAAALFQISARLAANGVHDEIRYL